jgi:hypothetical protein
MFNPENYRKQTVRESRILIKLMSALAPMVNLPEVGSTRLGAPLSLEELKAALDQCNNFCLGLYGLRFSLFKVLSMVVKLCLLDIFNDILGTRVVPPSADRPY